MDFIKIFQIFLVLSQLRFAEAGWIQLIDNSGSFPIYSDLGKLNKDDNLKLKLLIPTNVQRMNFNLSKGTYQKSLGQVWNITLYSGQNYEFNITETNFYYFIRKGGIYLDKIYFQLTINGVVYIDIKKQHLNWGYNSIQKFFHVKNSCRVKVDPNLYSDPFKRQQSIIWKQISYNLTQSLTPSFYDETIFDLTKGNYSFQVQNLDFKLNVNFSFPIFHDEDHRCDIIQLTKCKWVGSSHRELCRIYDGQYCSTDGNSNCLSSSICGNGIFQNGEDCDNGNKTGCVNCRVESPYKCQNKIGMPSVCFICGNSIHEVGEQCDNGNKSGCINCTRDRGYTCKSKLNQISNCTSICGDGLWTPEEECDNGNQTGCINCRKDLGYTCRNKLVAMSKCNKCGNFILESGEQCDNSNPNGCKNCQIQPGWNCLTDPRYCFLVIQVCGNSQRQIVEQCDDGNKANGDGCSLRCKMESGFTCSRGLGEKSVCSRVVQ